MLEIVNLADRREYLEEVSEWLWNQWRRAMGAPLSDVVYRSEHCIEKDRMPQMYVALLDGKAVGVVSLWMNDLATRQDLYPWLATLYTKEEYRGRGIGEALQKRSIQAARECGYETIYLVTELEGYYEKTGWEFMEHAPEGDGATTKLYRYDLK